jgi:hypothetical protein
MRADLVVERHGLDDVEQLALVFVDALDLDVEHRGGIDRTPMRLLDEIGEAVLVGALDAAKRSWKSGSSAKASSAFSASMHRPWKASPMRSRIRLVRPGLHCISQRRGVMPLVLLLMRSG